MARPAPLRNRRDRFRVVEAEDAPDDLSPSEHMKDDSALTQAAAGAQARPRADSEWPGAMAEAADLAAAIPSVMRDDAAALAPDTAEMVPAQPEPVIETKPSPAKQGGGMSAISLAAMALIAAGLSAAAVLFLF